MPRRRVPLARTSLLHPLLRPAAVGLALCLGLVPAFALGDTDLEPSPAQGAASKQLARDLERGHYLGLPLDDTLSERLFDRYLEFLDPSRMFLLAADVEAFGAWRERLDDALRGGDLTPAFDLFNVFHERQLEVTGQIVGQLSSPDGLADLPLGPEQRLQLDRSHEPWPADEAERTDLWARRLASQLLDLQLAGRSDEEARGLLLERYTDMQRRIDQTKAEDVFQLFMNALTSAYDPHTQYLVPRAAENFDMQMSLSLEGIGALLRPDGEYARVERIIPAGPAEKNGELQAGDRILGVGQGTLGEVVDVVGWRLDDVVALVRGPRGSIVTLQVRAADAPESAAPRQIVITRDEVKLEEQAARKEVVELPREDGPLSLGVVELPSFYSDMEAATRGDADYKSSTRDVAQLLGELEAQGVQGVLLDLRGNGGGSLTEAHELAGLLLGQVPAVQVRDAEGRVQLLEGSGEAAWTGPLVVLVDRLSASASEIVTAAVQDYRRGVVIGERTFGKGTVQAVKRAADGRLIVTIAKFYRVSGDSTQHAGVTPDLELPALYDPTEVGESALENPLPWDHIAAVSGHRRPPPDTSLEELLPELRRRHETRSAHDHDLIRLRQEVALLQEAREETSVSLDLETRRAEQAAYEARREEIAAAWRQAKGLSAGEESERAERVDGARQEALAVLADLVELRRAASQVR